MNEAETRAEHIDPLLAQAGWGVVEGSRIRREYAITPGRIEAAGRRGKGLSADYVLEYRNTKLAVIEAKAWDKAMTEGVGQAKDYAEKLSSDPEWDGLPLQPEVKEARSALPGAVGEIRQPQAEYQKRQKIKVVLADACADLGRPEEIGKVFSGFQKYLYQQRARA